MRHLTASQKIALLERRVANMEKQAIFGLFKSKEEKERARNIENLQREVSRADKMDLKQIKALKTTLEDLWVEPDYVKEHKEAIQSMIGDLERTLKRKEEEEIRKEKEEIRKGFKEKISGAKDLGEYYRIMEEAERQGVRLYSSDVEERLFLCHLLEPYDKNFKLSRLKRNRREVEGHITIRGHKYKIVFGFRDGNRHKPFLLKIGVHQLFYGLVNYPISSRERGLLEWSIKRYIL